MVLSTDSSVIFPSSYSASTCDSRSLMPRIVACRRRRCVGHTFIPTNSTPCFNGWMLVFLFKAKFSSRRRNTPISSRILASSCLSCPTIIMSSIVHKLKIARGQLDGILQMVEENRYCVDISNQLLATQALLKSANQQILQAHIRSCVREALQTDAVNPKLEEALKLLEKMIQ